MTTTEQCCLSSCAFTAKLHGRFFLFFFFVLSLSTAWIESFNYTFSFCTCSQHPLNCPGFTYFRINGRNGRCQRARDKRITRTGNLRAGNAASASSSSLFKVSRWFGEQLDAALPPPTGREWDETVPQSDTCLPVYFLEWHLRCPIRFRTWLQSPV